MKGLALSQEKKVALAPLVDEQDLLAVLKMVEDGHACDLLNARAARAG
jgi:hypothetical protein